MAVVVLMAYWERVWLVELQWSGQQKTLGRVLGLRFPVPGPISLTLAPCQVGPACYRPAWLPHLLPLASCSALRRHHS